MGAGADPTWDMGVQLNPQTVTCIKVKALKLKEEPLPDLEEKLGLTNERKQIPDKSSPDGRER